MIDLKNLVTLLLDLNIQLLMSTACRGARQGGNVYIVFALYLVPLHGDYLSTNIYVKYFAGFFLHVNLC